MTTEKLNPETPLYLWLQGLHQAMRSQKYDFVMNALATAMAHTDAPPFAPFEHEKTAKISGGAFMNELQSLFERLNLSENIICLASYTRDGKKGELAAAVYPDSQHIHDFGREANQVLNQINARANMGPITSKIIASLAELCAHMEAKEKARAEKRKGGNNA